MNIDVLRSFLDEIEKIAMARASFEPGAHVGLRLLQRVGVPSASMDAAETALKKAIRIPGGEKHLGTKNYYLDLGDKGKLVFEHVGDAGHVAKTLLEPHMVPKAGTVPMSESALNAAERKQMKKMVRKAFKTRSGGPSRKDVEERIGRRIFNARSTY